MAKVLEVNGLTMQFRGLTAVTDYNLTLEKGSINGLIGTNGAGKTTIFNILTGLQKPTSGRIFFEGKDITGWRPDQITRQGIARTFQNLRLFGGLTVLDNVLIGAQIKRQYGFLAALAGLPALKRGEGNLRESAWQILEALGLKQNAMQLAGSLPYGSQRRLEIARALATRPRLLLLDEPAAGMNPKESQQLMEIIRGIRAQFDLTIFLIEHDMRVVMRLCHHLQVLCYGRTIAAGLPEEIQNDPQVIEAYLGRSARHA